MDQRTTGQAGLGPNHRRLMQLLRRHAPISRAELAGLTGLTQAAVSMLVQDLISRGLVVEAGRRQGRRGPPQIDLTPRADAGFALGIHADTYAVYLTLLDFCGSSRGERRIQNRFDDVRAAIRAVVDGAGELLAGCDQTKASLVGAGLALPTRFGDNGILLNLAEEVRYWRGTDVARVLSDELGCAVLTENDASAAALGELANGNPGGYDNFFYLYLSGGIGGAIVMDGQLCRGTRGNAGEIGSLKPRGAPRPSFDDLARFLQDNGVALPEGRDCDEWDRLLARVPDLTEAWLERASRETAELLFAACSLLDPMAVYIGGTLPLSLREAISRRIDFEKVSSAAHAREDQPVIEASKLTPQSSAASGVAALALREDRQGPGAGGSLSG